MTAEHIEVLVEEPSMEAFLHALLPRILPSGRTFQIHSFQGKSDLLGKLEARLRGYAAWLPDRWRIVVIVDRDDEDCLALKRQLERVATASRLRTRSRASHHPRQLVNRITIEELEAWYFGDWVAVCKAYPRVSPSIPRKQGYRDPDAISGGAWEAFERILQRYGYFKTGLRKIEAARILGAHLDPNRNQSPSFRKFNEAIIEAMR